MSFTPWLESLALGEPNLPASAIWLRTTNLLCALGMLATLLVALPARYRQRTAGAGPLTRLLASTGLVLLIAACSTTAVSVGYRWLEVNHFPSQTMSEVLVMFTLALLVSQVVLHFALGLQRIGPGWAHLGDGIAFFVLLGSWSVNVYSQTLSSAQRDLPPALQSAWFPFHLSALIFSYATLAIAAVLCLLFFVIRLWGGVFGGEGRRTLLQLLSAAGVAGVWIACGAVLLASGLPLFAVLGGLAAVVVGSLAAARRWLPERVLDERSLPLWMLLGVVFVSPVLGKAGLYLGIGLALMVALVGGVFAALAWLGARRGAQLVPAASALAAVERQMDQVSFRAFSVGFPFLTAGLWMGAFWAQEAWANYWGWDSKENSALITWLVYVVYIHLRMLGGYRGTRAMAVLTGGAISILITFQLFGYFPDSQKSLHRYTDDSVVPQEGMQAPPQPEGASAQAPADDVHRGLDAAPARVGN